MHMIHSRNSLKWYYNVLLILFLFLNVGITTAAEEWSYTVRPGDNLWNLTERHLTSMNYVARLQQMNNVKNPYVIPPGTRLRIPVAWTRITQDAHARIINVYGTARVIRPQDGIVPATLGMQLSAGDRIQSENDSFVTVEFADQSQMRMQDNTTVRLDDLKIFGDLGLVDTLVHLEEGRTESAVPKDSTIGTRFRIQTPSAISSVRGTDFRVGTLNEQSATTSKVLDGSVEVSGERKAVKVSGGFDTVTSVGTQPAPPVKLLPPPDLSNTNSYYDSLPLVIRLNPLEGARGYRAQIAIDSEFNTLFIV